VADLDVSVVVSRTGADLELNDGTKYTVVDLSPGGRTWRRSTVEGRYQHGRKSIGEVIDTASMSFTVRVMGTSFANAMVNAVAMRDALAQHAYTVTTVIEGVTQVFVCEPADMDIVGRDGWNKYEIARKRHTYVLTIPYDPTLTEVPA